MSINSKTICLFNAILVFRLLSSAGMIGIEFFFVFSVIEALICILLISWSIVFWRPFCHVEYLIFVQVVIALCLLWPVKSIHGKQKTMSSIGEYDNQSLITVEPSGSNREYHCSLKWPCLEVVLIGKCFWGNSSGRGWQGPN